MPVGALLGASGAGRRAQLLAWRPDLGIREVDGDTEQQLISFGRGEFSGLVLAACGLLRLDLRNRIQAFIEPDALLPPPGQGALSLVVREGDEVADELAYGLHHNLTALRTAAERAFAARLGAGPLDPVGALAQIESDGSLRLEGLLATRDGSTLLRGEISGKPGEAEELGYELAEDILQQGGLAIMARP